MCNDYLRFWALCYFFCNEAATTEISTLSLHDALPISAGARRPARRAPRARRARGRHGVRVARAGCARASHADSMSRSEEHTSELQSQSNLVCRLLLEKKKNNVDDGIS